MSAAEAAPEQQQLQGQIITAQASSGEDTRVDDCIVNECHCECHDSPPLPAGIYVTLALEGNPRIGVGGRFQLVEIEDDSETDQELDSAKLEALEAKQ